MQIAKIIQQQIGRMAFMMIGAKNLTAIENGLQFTVGSNSHRVKWIQVILQPMDTYLFRALKADGTVAMETEDVYFDMLRQQIEDATGMYTKL